MCDDCGIHSDTECLMLTSAANVKVSTEESLHAKLAKRSMEGIANDLRETVNRIDRIASLIDKPRDMFAAEFYTERAAQVIKEIFVTTFNMHHQLMITSAGQADVARRLDK